MKFKFGSYFYLLWAVRKNNEATDLFLYSNVISYEDGAQHNNEYYKEWEEYWTVGLWLR
jgi:hypothetical protein